jgi:hypothetical protein
VGEIGFAIASHENHRCRRWTLLREPPENGRQHLETLPSWLRILDRAHGPNLVSPTSRGLSSPSRRSSTPMTTDLPPCSALHSCPLLLIAHPPSANLSLAAAPPPASLFDAWAALPGFLLQVEEGRSSAKRWTALPPKPRREAKSGPEAGAAARSPLKTNTKKRTARDEHQEPNTRDAWTTGPLRRALRQSAPQVQLRARY